MVIPTVSEALVKLFLWQHGPPIIYHVLLASPALIGCGHTIYIIPYFLAGTGAAWLTLQNLNPAQPIDSLLNMDAMVGDTPQNDYILHSKNELTRLAYQHRIIKDALNNRLVWAPIDFTKSPLQVLDLCTADGPWIRDLQSDIAPNDVQHVFFGTDIEASYFPSSPPRNTSYYVQDSNAAWPAEWKGKFDLIHQRLALCYSGGVDPTLDTVRREVELLKPGGWIQFVELQKWTADHDGPGWRDFTTCMAEMIESIGSSVTHIDRVKGWFEGLGLVDVEEKVFEGNFGTRDEKELEKIAKKSAMTTAESILGVVQTFPQELLSVPVKRVPKIMSDLEKEMITDPTNAHWHYKVVWGKKPECASSRMTGA